MADPLVWNPGNDNVLIIVNARNLLTGAPIIGASGQARIETFPGGVLISGITNPLPLAELASSPGTYYALADKSAVIADGQDLVAKWTLDGAAGESAAGDRKINVRTRDS